MHKKVLDVREYGYVSVIDFIANFSEVVQIDRPNPQGDWILFDIRNTQSAPVKGQLLDFLSCEVIAILR